MTVRVEIRPYGDAALATLRDLIAEAKGDDPFHPVTVVVSRGAVGLSIRRTLAAQAVPGSGHGVVNVTFTTLDGLADSLTGTRMVQGGRGPLTDAALRAAVRSALAMEAGPLLTSTRDHPSTIDALVATYRELRTAGDDVMDRLAAGSKRAAETIGVIRATRNEASRYWYDTVDVLDAATELLEQSPPPSGLGTVVVYLPSALTGPAARLVRALGACLTCVAVVGVTGDPKADELAEQMITLLGPSDAVRPQAVAVPLGHDVMSAPTGDAEILVVLRDVMARCEAGTRPERIAIAHAGTPEVVTLLHTMLQQAGIPFNGSGVRPLSSSVAGRMLLGALELTEHDWRREDVVAWLGTGPLRQDGRPIPSSRWDVLSADVGVSQGLADWRARLEDKARALMAEAEFDPEDDESRRRARQEEATRCRDLVRFLDDMERQVGEAPTTWEDWTKWADGLLDALTGGPAALDRWPAGERAAAEAVKEAIGRLSVLGLLRAQVSPPEARAALEAELGVPSPQTTRFGAGIWVAPLSAVPGHPIDVLYLIGMNDGIFPGKPQDDVLIPDREREQAQGPDAMPMRGDRSVTMRRDYLAALAGAHTRILSYPRGSQRDRRELRPSRWLLDTLGPLTGHPEPLYSSELGPVRENEHYRKVASFIGAVAADGTPVSVADRDLRSVLRWTSAHHPLADHWLAHRLPGLARGDAFIVGSSRGFNRFNGELGSAAPTHGLVPDVFSASRLESFATCPRQYFFARVLGVAPRPEPSDLLMSDPMERGTLIHRILERFIRAQIELGADDGVVTSEARLLEIADEEMAEYAALGLAPPHAAWVYEQRRIKRELRAFLAADRAWRDEHGATPIGVEQTFGQDAPVVVSGAGAQSVRIRGAIDRIDRTTDGRLMVTDYKTGKPERYKGIDTDHFGGNRSLQLALYGYAVAPEGPPTVEYLFVSEAGACKRLGFEFTDDDARHLEEVVHTYADTIARGHFPANPGDEHQCSSCDYDSVCPSNRRVVWERVQRTPALTDYVNLVAHDEA